MFLEYATGEQSQQHSYHTLNTIQTAILPFAITVIGDFTCDSSYFTRRWEREDCLLLYTLDGVGIIEYEGKEITLSRNQLIVLDCRKYHYYATKGDHWHFLWVHFTGKCAFDYVELLNGTEDLPISFNFYNYYKKLVSHVTSFNLQSELEISVIMNNLLTELIGLKKATGFSEKYDKYNSALQNNIAFLQQHFHEEISISQCAKQMHLSKFYYIKVFKSYTGQTPYDYLLGLRLQAAQKLLLETNLAVNTIAEKCGFTNSKNFIPHFKQKVGMTPSCFRKAYLKPLS